MRILPFLLVAACAPRASAVVIGIDFGARFLKIAVIKPGSGIEMVFNEASKRKSSAAVAFNLEDERVLGDDAYNLAPRLPRRTYAYIKTLLGKALNSPAVAAMTRLGFPYDFETNKTSSTLAIKQDASTSYLIEELGAFILSYAKKISEAHVEGVVRDCVLTVPPYWKVSERLALLRAAEIANLNVLSLVHETTAVAFKYGFDKETLFAEKPLNVVFYDLGASSYKVSVVEFASTVNKKNKTVGSLTIKGVAWDEELGGVNFDACVADYLVDSFVKEHPKQGKTLRSSERGMAKIRKEAERIKETLRCTAPPLAPRRPPTCPHRCRPHPCHAPAGASTHARELQAQASRCGAGRGRRRCSAAPQLRLAGRGRGQRGRGQRAREPCGGQERSLHESCLSALLAPSRRPAGARLAVAGRRGRDYRRAGRRGLVGV
jgi:hypoxia up-regulated 1